MTTIERRPDDPYTVADLQRVTGLGRDNVRALILAGQLPGYKLGKKYVVPAGGYRALVAGTWKPQPREVVITNAPTLLHTVNRKAS